MNVATELRCVLCGKTRVANDGTDWLHCPRCELVYCAPCVERTRRDQWAAGEASTVSCRSCGGILLTAL